MTTKAVLVSTSLMLMMLMGAVMMTRCSSVDELDDPGSGRFCQAYKNSTVIYCMIMEAMTWSRALLHCASLGGSLADMENQADQDFQVALATKAGVERAFWLSGSDIESNYSKYPVFKWIPEGILVNTSLFGGKEPTSPGQEHCTCVWLVIPGSVKLGDWECSKTIPFLCKFNFEK